MFLMVLLKHLHSDSVSIPGNLDCCRMIWKGCRWRTISCGLCGIPELTRFFPPWRWTRWRCLQAPPMAAGPQPAVLLPFRTNSAGVVGTGKPQTRSPMSTKRETEKVRARPSVCSKFKGCVRMHVGLPEVAIWMASVDLMNCCHKAQVWLPLWAHTNTKFWAFFFKLKGFYTKQCTHCKSFTVKRKKWGRTWVSVRNLELESRDLLSFLGFEELSHHPMGQCCVSYWLERNCP